MKAEEFERELYKLINNHVSNGLSKPELVSKLEYVTLSCKLS